ncbi:hypothetical protein L1987_64946 [Smallanthus sonchifolius]|uniref:Uncharacterized protein n=1 Tax=Smallanthus sonchifolius TaxID=185202 RepID=A0ACB9BTA6_9ASTR|nr:hypothetical protein L1987_64946 [Smallanthus sonchifolius]
MSNPHRKFFKLVKPEALDNKHEIAIKLLPGNVKPLKLEISSTLELEGTILEDLPPLDVKDVLAVPPSIISEDHSPPHPYFDFGPFDDDWVLNYDFSQYSTPTNPTNYLFPHVTGPLDEDSKSVDSVESIGTLLRWANHNPWENELNADSDYNPWENEFSVVFY